MSVRFMPDGRLKTEGGSLLDPGPWLDDADAKVAVGAVQRVLLHSYPDTIELDETRAEALIATVSIDPELEGHSARVYRRGDERILVIEHHH